MTKKEALEILEKPIFNDPQCIKACKFLEEEEEADKLRKKLVGKKVECWCCEGDGELRCKAGCMCHICPTCDGEDKLTLSTGLLKELDLIQLKDLIEEAA